ncbi:MAG: hypothetical protein WCG04_05050 [Alphaproteobacteria bacterium]
MSFYALAAITLWLIWVDWRSGQLPVLGLALLIGLGLLGEPEIVSALILGVTALLCWYLGYCGSGDIYLLLACGLWVPLALLPYFCILVGILILVLVFFLSGRNLDQRGFPLAPPLLVALWSEEGFKMFFS